jgi:hypothetical protein
MESMNLLDITIKYFNVIVFVLCVLFGMMSFFASWIAWREIHHKRNIVRSILAAYNITEDTVEKGRTPSGDIELDPVIVQTVFNSLQEILNAVYGEITGKPLPPKEERAHGSRRSSGLEVLKNVFTKRQTEERLDSESDVPSLVPEEKEHQHGAYYP